MTEFKQIIGRGTRINEDYNKFFFTIMDFKKATELFADPDFDGDPVVIYSPKIDDSPVPPDDLDNETNNEALAIDGSELSAASNMELENWTNSSLEEQVKVKKYYVSNVAVSVLAERVQYYDANGKLITESLKDYTRKTLNKEFSSLDDFLKKWTSADKKYAVIEEMANEGIFFDALAAEIGKDLDPFDIVCHVAWDKPPLTRKERAENVKKRNYFSKYGEQVQRVLSAILDKYADEGVTPIEETQILTINPFTHFGTPMEIIKMFGGVDQYQNAIHELEQAIYAA
jgi:type I restriction enzyme R subunit